MTASKIEMGYLLGASLVRKLHGELTVALSFLLSFSFFMFDRSPEPQILSCSTLVVLCCRQSGVYYFPAAGRIIYEGTLSDYLQVSNKKQVRDIITVIKGKFRKIALSKRSRWKNRFTRREGEKKSEAR